MSKEEEEANMNEPVMNSVSSTDILTTEMNRLTVSGAECKTTSSPLLIQRSSGSSSESPPCLSRDPSTELYTDFCGVDSQQFLMETLKNNVKSRSFLIGIEKEVLSFIRDDSKSSYKFPVMNTFNRMLVHRVAAFFGLDHSVDQKRSPDCVTVTKCEKTRIPDMKFEEVSVAVDPSANHAPDNHVVEPKQVLKRSEGKGASYEKSPDRRNNGTGSSMKKSGSYEERQVRYQHARDRIFASQASSSSDGTGDASSGISTNVHTTANSSLKSSQDNVSEKPWSSFESGTVSASRRLKRQNRVVGSLDSENMTTSSSNFLTPDYRSPSQESSGKKLGAVPKASSFGGATECSTKVYDLTGSESRLPRNNSFNATTENGSGDAGKQRKREDGRTSSTSNHQHENANSNDHHQENPVVESQSNNSNATISPPESNAQVTASSSVTEPLTASTSPSDSSQSAVTSVGILPKPPLVHQSSAPDGSRVSSHQQQHPNHRQNSWQAQSHHHSFNYQQHQQNPRWHQQPPHYQSTHYSGPRHRYPRGMNYNSPAHSSGRHFATGPSLPPPGSIPSSPAAAAFWPHPDLRSQNPLHVIMSPKDALMAQQQMMQIQGVNLIQNPEQILSGMYMGHEAAAQMMPPHYQPQHRIINSNGNHHQTSGPRIQNPNPASSSYGSQSFIRQSHHQQQQQQQQQSLAMSAAPGVYYVNPQSGANGAPPQFVMLSPRLPANVNYNSGQYASHQPQQQPQQDSSVSGIPVSMPISYSSIPSGNTGVQPVAYLVSGVPTPSGPGLLPVPYAAYPAPPPGSHHLTMPANPFPSPYPSVSYDPTSCLTSYPEYRLFTSSSPTQGITHPAAAPAGVAQAAMHAAAGGSFIKHSPPPPPASQQQQHPASNQTPPLMQAPVNPQYFSGYTICAPSNLPHGMAPPPIAVNQFCHMGGGLNPSPQSHHQHQYHQPRSRNSNNSSGVRNHFRSS